MSRKHFVKLAAAVRLIADPADRLRVAGLLADLCQSVNPRFDRARFYRACGV